MIFFSDKTVIPLGGPTASGKSAVALELATALEGEIVNADSIQLYKDLPILTARPSQSDTEMVPHHLYGILEPSETSTVAAWLDQFSDCVSSIETTNAFIAVGGTGLYLSSLIYGLSSIPEISEGVRYQIRQQGKALVAASGESALYACVVRRDPLVAGRIHPNHTQRLLRAWEVVEQTGISIFQWQKEPRQKLEFSHSPLFVIDVERDMLRNRIQQRCHKMIDEGCIEEVKDLWDRTSDRFYPIHRAIGFQEIKRFLEGNLTLEQAIEEIVNSTCQYAKRQQTWFRTQYQAGDIILIPMDTPQNQASMILKKLCSFGEDRLSIG